MDQRLGELDPLLHPGRVRIDLAITHLTEPDVKEHLVCALHRIGGRKSGELAAIGDKGDRVDTGNLGVGFRHIAEPRPDVEGTLGNVHAEHAHPPGV